MNYSDRQAAPIPTDQTPVGTPVLIAGEAGVPFAPSLDKASGIDPIAEWLDLMEVVQMLCPTWPVRDQPMQGTYWLL